MALRPTRLLPPKRLSTPRSARRLSTTNRGLLPGPPATTRAGLTPAGLIQSSGRNIARSYWGQVSIVARRNDSDVTPPLRRSRLLAELQVDEHERGDEERVPHEQEPDRPVTGRAGRAAVGVLGCVSASAASSVPGARRGRAGPPASGTNGTSHVRYCGESTLPKTVNATTAAAHAVTSRASVVGAAPVGSATSATSATRAASVSAADDVGHAAAEVDRARLAGDPVDVVDRRAFEPRAGATSRPSRSGGAASPASRG